MASPKFWSKIKNFSPKENWGNPDKMDEGLLLELDKLRSYLGFPIVILCGNQGKHSPKSYHYIKNGSCAVDIIIPDYPKTPFDLILDVTRFSFTGIGYYPHWRYKDNLGFGLHLDTRKAAPARWMGIKDDSGKQIYIELSYQNLIKHGGEYGNNKQMDSRVVNK